MQYVGIDVHTRSSQLCFVDDNGEITEKRIPTERTLLQDLFRDTPPSKVLLEATTEGEWVARCIEELGHEVVVADANYAPMYATLNRRVKTDRRDAQALCDACRLGAYRPAHRCSERGRQLRTTIGVREALVRTRSRYISLMRAHLRRDGYRIPSGGVISFERRVGEVQIHQRLQEQIEPLLGMMEKLNQQIRAIDRQLEEQVKNDPVAQRLCSVPGIGPVTALLFISVVDQVERFSSAHRLAAYLGLVPREFSSGEKRFRGRITKAGNPRLRFLLVEAAWRILCRPRPETEYLQRWAERISERHGRNVAVVALARKLSGILYAIWRDGTEFYSPAQRKAAKEVLTA